MTQEPRITGSFVALFESRNAGIKSSGVAHSWDGAKLFIDDGPERAVAVKPFTG
jgi:hypothetical protein